MPNCVSFLKHLIQNTTACFFIFILNFCFIMSEWKLQYFLWFFCVSAACEFRFTWMWTLVRRSNSQSTTQLKKIDKIAQKFLSQSPLCGEYPQFHLEFDVFSKIRIHGVWLVVSLNSCAFKWYKRKKAKKYYQRVFRWISPFLTET